MSIDAEIPMLEAAPEAPATAVPPAKPAPVTTAERLQSIDVLRGVGVLGILAMNIVGFAYPMSVYFNPTLMGGFEGSDRLVWIINHLIFDSKMWTIFTMLFGAGLVLMSERAAERGVGLARLYYRRVLWLMVIGAVHAYLLWEGDILLLYAECGLLLYFFRRRSPRALIITGASIMLVLLVLGLLAAAGIEWLEGAATQAELARQAGAEPTEFQLWAHELWTEHLQPDPEKRAKELADEVAIYRGSYLDILTHRLVSLWPMHTVVFLLYLVWLLGSRMLLGMGLMKLGVFSARRSRRFYVWLAVVGYGLGLPLVAYDAHALIRDDFALAAMIRSMFFFNFIGSLAVALGHIGLVMLASQRGVMPWLLARLAAVGRMALTNYLLQTLICTTLFYGYSFGLFGTINRTGLAGIVLAIWVAQLVWSPLWLKRFRFGPAEWLWRSLTYRKWQPMRPAEQSDKPPLNTA
jgi:uncharacterized protein